eukprot:283387-Chlamydomonas_euryale.AAC.1
MKGGGQVRDLVFRGVERREQGCAASVTNRRWAVAKTDCRPCCILGCLVVGGVAVGGAWWLAVLRLGAPGARDMATLQQSLPSSVAPNPSPLPHDVRPM